MIKFKTFFGNSSCVTADEKANSWLTKHTNIRICNMQYQQTRYGDHSICIMYDEYSPNLSDKEEPNA